MSNDINIYRYGVAGRRLEVVELSYEEGLYITPTKDNTQALLVEYSVATDPVQNELDIIDTDEQLSEAVIFYVRARLAEEVGNFQLARVNDIKFNEFVRKSIVKRTGTNTRTSIPNSIVNLKG